MRTAIRECSLLLSAAMLIVIVAGANVPASAAPITFRSLLDEMVDREALTRFPYPPYMTRQFSSYDRRSTSPDDAETWFANSDAGNYLRIEEERDGRREYVMMDAEGPGAVVRIWSANPKGNMRVYLDAAEDPVIEAPMTELLSGEGIFAAPLSAVRSRGWNLYIPIPYAKRCVITSDEGGFYYQINYRTYSPAADVESFTTNALEQSRARLDSIQAMLLDPPTPDGEAIAFDDVVVKPGEKLVLLESADPRAISEFRIRIFDAGTADLPIAMRTLILLMRFDDRYTVQIPLSDFFACTPGVNPYESWWMSVAEDGWMTSRFVMPWRDSAEVAVKNLATSETRIEGAIRTRPYEWGVRSMQFHATWNMQRDISTRPMRDWSYISIQGRGVFVGDSLTVTNPVEQWWGEGDEKIYVDDETFPSHFGTGTEDYYGYAWCSNEEFEAPFHAQPRCDGPPGNYGQTTVSRFRSLDAIPFTKSLRFDMEVWHWAETTVTYAATSYWYADEPALLSRSTRLVPSALRNLPEPPPPFKIDGAIEGEELPIAAQTPGVVVGAQDLWKRETYSGDRHLWVQARKVGDFVEFELPVEEQAAGRYAVAVFLTTSWDYGVVQASVDGEPAGEPIDTFNTKARDIGATGAVDLGAHELKSGSILRIEVVGANPASEGAKYFWGLDAVRLTPVN